MRRSALLTALPLTLVALLAGCATPSATPMATEAATAVTPTPTPTPTPEILVVGAGERPPAVFGGDCAAALSIDAVQDAVGAVEITLEDAGATPTMRNIGGIGCSWSGTDAGGGRLSGSVTILPRAGLGGAALDSSTHDFYFVDCDGYWCAWESEDAGLVITGASSGLSEDGRADADAQGAAIAGPIHQAFEDEPWERDRTGWWSANACAALAEGLGELLGGPIVETVAGYHDPPMPGLVLADTASHMSWCGLVAGEDGGGGYVAEVRLDAGAAWWATAADFESAPVEPTNVTAYIPDYAFGYVGYSPDALSYVLTDGVNVMQLSVPAESPWPAAEVLAAAAEWVAAGGTRS